MSPRDRAELGRWVRSPSMPAGLVMRVRVVLAAADGTGTGAEWPYVDPNPLGALRQSRTAFYRLLPR